MSFGEREQRISSCSSTTKEKVDVYDAELSINQNKKKSFPQNKNKDSIFSSFHLASSLSAPSPHLPKSVVSKQRFPKTKVHFSLSNTKEGEAIEEKKKKRESAHRNGREGKRQVGVKRNILFRPLVPHEQRKRCPDSHSESP
jgi:hypothetical protein